MDTTDGLSLNFYPGMLTFSQAQGYEELPGRIRLETLMHMRDSDLSHLYFKP